MKFYVYKTTNLINGRYYVGVHGSEDFESDRYMGSGRHIKPALAKYGRENFKRETIKECETKEEAFELEELIVDQEFVDDPMTYNIVTGGGGSGILKGEDHPMYGTNHSEEHKNKISQSLRNYYDNLEEYPEELREVYRESRIKYIESIGGTLKEETKKKISNSLKGRYGGEKHPMYGKKHTQEALDKITKSVRERVADPNYIHPNKGKSVRDEVKKQISETLKSKPRGKCPHCGKEGVLYALKRYHFDKCKFK